MCKFFRFSFLTAIFAIAMFSCGGGTSSPTDTAKKVCNAMVAKDTKTLLKYFNLSAADAAEAKDLVDLFLEGLQPAKYELKGEEISSNGKTARVKVKFTSKSGEVEDTELEFTKTDSGWKLEMF